MDKIIDVVIPAYNEELAIANVINDIPKSLVREIIVCNNASTDDTAKRASDAGATVLSEPRPGYGQACLKGLDHIASKEVKPHIVVFIDGDYSDYPQEMNKVVQPLIDDVADLVIGSRALGKSESGAMMPQQVFGNWLATRLIKLIFGHTYTDLGPFRGIKYSALQQIQMEDTNYGWTVEMQVKAVQHKLRITEVPVNYKVRIGTSKVSGTVKGTIMAGYKILWTIAKYTFVNSKNN